MNKRVWISLGFLALVGCGGGTSSGSNPAPGASGGTNGSGNQIPSQLDPNLNTAACKPSQFMWGDKCFDRVHLSIDGLVVDQKGSVVSAPSSIKIELQSGERTESLFELGKPVSKLLKAMKWNVSDKSSDLKYTRWVTAVGGPIRFVTTPRDENDILDSDEVVEIGSSANPLGAANDGVVMLGDWMKGPMTSVGGNYTFSSGCPYKGSISINGIRAELPLSEVDVKKVFPDLYKINDEGTHSPKDIFLFGHNFQDGCVRKAESYLYGISATDGARKLGFK
jgi:hypothetical protein